MKKPTSYFIIRMPLATTEVGIRGVKRTSAKARRVFAANVKIAEGLRELAGAIRALPKGSFFNLDLLGNTGKPSRRDKRGGVRHG